MAPSSWYSEAHDAERVLYEHLRASRARTWNPAQASLFYVPFFSAHFTASHSHDPRHDLQQAVTATSQVHGRGAGSTPYISSPLPPQSFLPTHSQKWQQLLTRVHTAYPYFNHSGGADRPLLCAAAGDHARCCRCSSPSPSLLLPQSFSVSHPPSLPLLLHFPSLLTPYLPSRLPSPLPRPLPPSLPLILRSGSSC
ncbi:unnamed protein product [Closterium sp. NIES-54]